MTNEKMFKDISKENLAKLKKTSQPSFVRPMLATLTDKYFDSNEWIYEHKFDGVRCLAYKKNGKVILLSRNDNSMNTSYPEIVQALERQKADNFIVDGEIVALEKGISNFELLQSRINLQDLKKIAVRSAQIPIIYNIFDVNYVNGYDVQKLPLYDRKTILSRVLQYNDMLVYTPFTIKKGIALYKKACKLKWEGVIAKRVAGSYVNARSRDWLKFKCVNEQELVIGGYTEPRGSRDYFGALLVGYYQDGKLKYAGKVGTGYSYQTLEILGPKLKKLEIKKCPFDNFQDSTKGIHWVSPKLVAEFGFAQWTRDNKLRVGRYRGLRNDKKAKDVVKEVPK